MLTCIVHRSAIASALATLVCISSSHPIFAQEPTFDSPDAAVRDKDFSVQGEYVGDKIGLQVIALGEGEFDLVVYQGGLPGDGWDRQAPQKLDGDAEVVQQFIQARGLKRTERSSPTLGAKPPATAVVLFDGTQKSLDDNWETGAKRSNDGLLIQGAMTKAKFKDYSLHIEFRTPYQPKARGQGRGNSGVYHQGRYETQVLDSFGLDGKNNETGGIYEVRDPDLNMCFPPLTWQTYDVDFTAPRFDASGKKIRDAILTVRLNGIEVQRDIAIPNPTRAAPIPETSEPGPIYLQDHGNPIRYRNIWLVPRDADKEAMRPRVPGFERFFAGQSSELQALGGQLLISQLGCTACHANQTPTLANRPAPDLKLVGTRIRRDYLLNYILQPHSTKVGTAMPDLLHGHDSAERQKIAESIASYLASTGELIDRSGDSGAARRGEEAFHTLGCTMCHAPKRGGNNFETTSVPLGDLTSKYTLDSLSKFLVNPHAVRSSGLMPKLISDLSEAREVACFLLGEQIIVPGAEQFEATVYYGSWDSLPDFDSLKVERKGTTNGLDLSIARRRDNFAMRFETFLPVNVAGNYTFHLGSDDGSRLLIDDQEVVNVDGIHPVQMKTGRVKLDAGVHRLRIDYFEKGGEEAIVLEVEGPDFGRTPIAGLVTADPKGNTDREIIKSTFQPKPELVAFGKEMFNSVGCAKCHNIDGGHEKATAPVAKSLASLRPMTGCLAQQVLKGLPNYDLSDSQRDAIQAAIATLNSELSAPQQLHLHLASNNCYACHSRESNAGDGSELHGEPELARDSFFVTRMQEMGNEGRVPPPLSGVGDKLKPEYIERIVDEGAKERPYMLTRMPGFGPAVAKSVKQLVVQLDRPATDSEFAKQNNHSNDEKIIATGRKLVGNDGLSCIKCHTFGDKATPGIQAIDMRRMTQRLNPDWFHRYMLNPTRYRPGTRMPLSFPDGKSVLTNVFDGNADQQIEAMWFYLSQGNKVREPVGLDGESIVLRPTDRPIIYRNFIDGVSPRGIAVGYPAQCNLAWDAEKMSLAFIWKNGFIDASKHWVGRGPGNQKPLGDFLFGFESSTPLAILKSSDEAWPKESARSRGVQFKGYKLNATGEPVFRYNMGQVEVEDAPIPFVLGEDVGFNRQLKVRITNPTAGIVFRAATGKITAVDGAYLVNDSIRIAVTGVDLKLIDVNGSQELRATLPASGEVTITEKILW